MKEFVKDYVELCKESGKFYKKHWKGLVVLNALIIGGEYAWYRHNVKQFNTYIKEDLNKEEEAQ